MMSNGTKIANCYISASCSLVHGIFQEFIFFFCMSEIAFASDSVTTLFVMMFFYIRSLESVAYFFRMESMSSTESLTTMKPSLRASLNASS